MHDAIPDEVKVERLSILNTRQREIQRTSYQRHMDTLVEVMVESNTVNPRGQFTGRSSQNKTVNFTMEDGAAVPPQGSYLDVRIDRIFPSSLAGIAASQPKAASPTLLAQQALNARFTSATD
jgi:tRNA-2-methylthio-N6-dimethylallyladenosine synthase